MHLDTARGRRALGHRGLQRKPHGGVVVDDHAAVTHHRALRLERRGPTVSPGGTSAYGTTTTLSANVASAGPARTGTVTFTDGGVAIDSRHPVRPSCDLRPEGRPGTQYYRAVYSGDTATAPATSSAETVKTQSLATSMTVTATQGDGDLASPRTSWHPRRRPCHRPERCTSPSTVRPRCSADLVADPTGGATATCRVTADVSASHAVAATFVPADPTAYGSATASTTFTPAASCATGLAALVANLAGGGTKTISAGALGSVSVTPTGSVGPCTGATSIGVSVSASLFNGTLTATRADRVDLRRRRLLPQVRVVHPAVVVARPDGRDLDTDLLHGR